MYVLGSRGRDSRGETVVVAAIVCQHSAGARGECILTRIYQQPSLNIYFNKTYKGM